jgi:hypothetical protein
MARWLPATLILFGALSLSGCNNDCQKLCAEIADYWGECGIAFGESDVADCRQGFAGTKGSDDDPSVYGQHFASCRALLAPEENAEGVRMKAIRARFTCEDMQSGPGGAFSD